MIDYNDIYIIEANVAKNRILITFFSYLSPEAHIQFKIDIVDSVERLAAHGRKIDLLFDLTQSTTQPQDIAEDNSWVYTIGNKIRKSAIAISSATYTMQLKRMALKTLPSDKNMHFFDNVREAALWLDKNS